MDVASILNQQLIDSLIELTNHEVVAGITDGEVAKYAASNEFGTDRIPARPFMQTAFQTNITKYENLLAKAVDNVINGADTVSALGRVGGEMQNDIVESITNGEWQANSQRTINQKGSSTPLIDTGQMRQAVHFEVRK